MIQKIDGITINGSNQFGGGWIFSCRYSIAYVDGKSTLIVSIVSESGNYQIDPSILNNAYCHPYQIQIGNEINITMYLEEYSVELTRRLK